MARGSAGACACAFLLCASLAFAQAQVDPTDALEQARDKVLERAERLPNYTCIQTVDRQYFDLDQPDPQTRSCDDIAGEARTKGHKLELNMTDRLRLDIKVSGGDEIGSWAGSSHFESSILDLVGTGPFGTGPFGTFASDIFSGDETSFRYLDEEEVNGVKLLHYTFRVPEEESHYHIQAGSGWRTTAYDGGLWIDPVSFDLKRLMIRTSELPVETGACEATTTVTYEETQIGDGKFLVPQRSELHFLMRDRRETRTMSSYSGCRVYHAESTLKFDDTAPKQADNVPAPEPHTFRSGLIVPLQFTEPIDTDTAAAGDIVRATVRKPVIDKQSQEIVIPSGAVVRGRIVRMRHWLLGSPRFEIGVLLDKLDMNGATYNFRAMLDRGERPQGNALGPSGLHDRGTPIVLPPKGESRSVGTFWFITMNARHIVPPGYESKWITY